MSNRTPQDWVSLPVKHFRAELNYPQGTWARATVALYSTKTRKHLVAYDDPNLHPIWVSLDSKNGQVRRNHFQCHADNAILAVASFINLEPRVPFL